MLNGLRIRTRILFSVAALMICSGVPAMAQEDPSLKIPAALESPRVESNRLPIKPDESYGTQSQELWIGATEFYPRTNVNLQYYAYYFWYQNSGSIQQYEAQVRLPSGAHVTSMRCDFNDNSATNNATVTWYQQKFDSATLTPTITVVAAVGSSGSSGYQISTNATDVTIQNRVGTVDTIDTLDAIMPSDLNVALRGCRFTWNRQVSPPPGTATFGDVPTTHLFFQYIEALAASGITSGCGGGNYCPDSAVTRGQLAVFLAKALGLHWTP